MSKVIHEGDIKEVVMDKERNWAAVQFQLVLRRILRSGVILLLSSMKSGEPKYKNPT